MDVTIQSAPGVEPLSTAEAKAAVGIDASTTKHDTIIASYVKAARLHVESVTRKRLITQTLDVTWDLAEWNTLGIDGVWYLPFPPLQSIDSFTTYDEDGDSTTLVEGTHYTLSGLDPAKVRQTDTTGWSPSRTQEAVVIRITVGYGDAGSDVPEDIREYLRESLRSMFDNRTDDEKIRPPAAALLTPYVFGV